MGDAYDHVTTNISPGPAEPHEIDFFYTREVSEILDPVTGTVVFRDAMGFRALSPNDQEVIQRCLEFILESGALSGEFQTRMGVSATAVSEMLRRWPEVDHCGDPSPDLIINNALNEVAHGISMSDAAWRRWFQCERR